MRELPWLGLGLSTNLSAADVPNPYRLKDARPELVDFVEYSAPLSLERAREEASLFGTMWQRKAELPALFHPVHLNLWGPKLESREQLTALAEQAQAVGSAWVGNDVAWWHAGGQPFPGYLYLTPPFDADGLAECTAHALHVQSFLPMPLALENPAVIARRGPLHVLDFMAELHARTGLPLILDLGHLLSFQLAAGLGAADGLDGFPLEQVIELHLAGGVVTTGAVPTGEGSRRGIYVDDHTQPVREELFALLSLVLPRCTSLRAVTFEGDGHPESIAAQTLERLRAIVPKSSAPTAVLAPSSTQVPALPESSRPWQLFSERFGAEPAREDAIGTRLELDLRLSIVAELLDRTFPLSRLLLAGTRDQLVSFTASAHFRGCFEGAGRLEQAYAAFARERLRASPDESLAAVLAFEQWAQSLAARPIRSDRVAPGVAVGQFPVDLSELLFASRALKRHLAHRGLGSGQLDLSGLSALPQIAARAPRRPWPLAVRRDPAGLSLVSLSARAARALSAAGDEAAWSEAQADAAALGELRASGLLR